MLKWELEADFLGVSSGEASHSVSSRTPSRGVIKALVNGVRYSIDDRSQSGNLRFPAVMQ